MALFGLPTELLLAIIQATDSEKDLNSFVRTNRTLYSIGNPHLYRTNASSNGSSALAWGAAHESIDTVRIALKYGADPNARLNDDFDDDSDDDSDDGSDDDFNCGTALMLAVECDRSDIAKVLLDNGASINETDENYETAIYRAARDNHPEVFGTLLNHPGVDPDTESIFSYTPLWWAAHHENVDMVEKLVCRKDVQVNWVNLYGETALYEASSGDSPRVTELLLSDPTIDPNIKTREGVTPLMHAAEANRPDSMRLLLGHSKTDIQELDNDGRPLLSYAVRSGDVEIVDCVLNLGADVNMVYDTGGTALCQAAGMGEAEMVSFLISRGADPTLENSIARAAWGGVKAVIDVLLRYPRVSVTVPDNYGANALHIVVSGDYPEILRRLLRREGVDVNVRDSSSMTPLIRAAMHKSVAEIPAYAEVMRFLLDEPRIEVNAQDLNGRTALFIAARNGCEESVTLLLQQPQVDSRITDNTRVDPSAIAESNGEHELAKLIAESRVGGGASQ